METEWKSFSTHWMRAKKWRALPNNKIEIHEEVPFPNEPHKLIVQCEIYRNRKEFSIPPEFTKDKNPIIMHHVAAVKVVERNIPYYVIHIDTILEIKYLKHHTID